MQFTVQSGPFIRLVEMVEDTALTRKQTKTGLRLVACHGGVCVESQPMVGKMEAIVREEGQCTLAGRAFLKGLLACIDAPTLTIQVDGHRVRFGRHSVSVSSFCAHAESLTQFQVFFASDIGLVTD